MKSFFKHANPDAFTELELAVMEGGNDLNDIMSESYSSEPELKHRVSVTVSDPQHNMASKRKEKIEKKVRLYAKDERHAQELAKHHFKKQGYKVHDSNYIGIVESNLDEISANTAMSYLHKTYDTKGYRGHTPQTKKGIERATRKVSQDAMRRDYERSSKLGLSTEEVEQVDEVSMGLLTRYKEKAGQQASAMNKAIPAVAASSATPEHKKAAINTLVQKGNKRFSGIIKATNKQFAKSMKKEEVEMNEAVTVKKQNYSWGKMVTVHHGSDTSYPLHPEHQKAIANLKPGEKTSFKDETNRTVHAEREGDKVHLSSKNSSTKTTVAHSHFAEQSIKETIKRIVHEAHPAYVYRAAVAASDARKRQMLKDKERENKKEDDEDEDEKHEKEVKEAPETYSQSPTSVPFTGGTKNKAVVTDKSGAKHTPMSRARHLARFAAMKQAEKKSK